MRVMPIALGCCLVGLFAGPARADDTVGQRHYVAEHVIADRDGRPLPYRATAEDIVVPAPGGRTTMFAFSYEKSDAPAADRPVIFAYNGNQVSSSIYLHMGLLGPRLYAFADGYEQAPQPGRVIDNPDPLLDTADIVVIDAPNTGLGQMLDGTPPSALGGTAEDADAFAAFIRAWLIKHKRTASPKYLLGESYGSVRSAAVVARLTQDADPIRFAGVILLGQAMDQSATTARTGNDLAYMLLLPSQAATAWYHRKAGVGRPLRAFVAEADRWARTRYITALVANDDLPPTERKAIARTLSRYLGLPPKIILAHDLRIDRPTFAQTLLADRGQWLSQNDGRILQPPGNPALSADRVENEIAHGFMAGLVSILPGEFGMPTSNDYRQEFAHKDWRFVYPATRWWYDYTPYLADAMARDPAMRLFFGCGDYDILTPSASARHAASHAGIAPDAVEYHDYGAGHMPYLGIENARAVTDDIRRFIRARAVHHTRAQMQAK